MHKVKTGRSLVCLLMVKPKFRSLKLLSLYETYNRFFLSIYNQHLDQFVLCIQVSCLRVCPCTKCVPGSYGNQNWVLDLLELQVHMVVSHFVGSRK